MTVKEAGVRVPIGGSHEGQRIALFFLCLERNSNPGVPITAQEVPLSSLSFHSYQKACSSCTHKTDGRREHEVSKVTQPASERSNIRIQTHRSSVSLPLCSAAQAVLVVNSRELESKVLSFTLRLHKTSIQRGSGHLWFYF